MYTADLGQTIPFPRSDNAIHRLGNTAEMNGNACRFLHKKACVFPLPAHPQNSVCPIRDLHISTEQKTGQTCCNISRYFDPDDFLLVFTAQRTAAEFTAFQVPIRFFFTITTVDFSHIFLRID